MTAAAFPWYWAGGWKVYCSSRRCRPRRSRPRRRRCGPCSISPRNARLAKARDRAEEDLRALNAELERRVAHRTSELEAAVKELDAFSYSVSHDLKAPLRAIAGFSHILLTDYADSLLEEVRRYLAVIRANTRQMRTYSASRGWHVSRSRESRCRSPTSWRQRSPTSRMSSRAGRSRSRSASYLS